MLDARKEEAFCTILREELQLATGCTEPIAVAYCAARLRQVLGERPRHILAEVSGNILKNVKSVVVPNTGGRRGLPAAIAVGVVTGDPEARLQVIAHVTEEDTAAIQAYLDSTDIRIDCPPTPRMLDIRLTGWARDHKAVVHVANNHTNIIYVERDGEVLLEKPHSDSAEDNLQDKSVLNVRDILTFAETVDVSRIEESVGRQLECNTAIAREGLRGDWGANIGSTLLLSGGDVETEARAWAAAGSDARMNGCEMPVVIVSGSGNVALYCAQKCTELGGKVIAMSDSKGYIYDPNGVNLDVLFDIKQKRRARISVYADEVPGSEYHEGCKNIWTVPCDIAMPCASQNEMDVEGAKAVIANGAMAVFEGANMPLTPEAISAVIEAGLLYTPGKASNAGGVATSGLEMSQNSLRMSWSFEEVDEKLHGIMKSIFQACYDASVECGQPGNMMLGANVAGFLKVADAMMAQGIV